VVSSGRASQSSPEVEVARLLVEALGGELSVEAQQRDGTWRARVSLPVAYRPSVLVVDNHPDFIGLISRYLAEDVWQVTGAQDVRQAKLKALELNPSAILLDVMMPGQDGWDLLLDLKSRPETKPIPVIICSVLYEPRMARALGAVGYLPKPISQTALLEALAPYRQGRLGRESAC
jgi:CheY-like chemotaxis protein